MKPTFRYSFKTADDTQWYYIENDVVKQSIYPKYFYDDTFAQVVSPQNWQETGIGFTRGGQGHGVYAKYTTPMNFTFEAERILQYVYSLSGFDGTILFVIEYIADPKYQVYSEFFKSELDLSQLHKIKNQNTEYTASNVREKGLVQKIQNQSNVSHNIPLDSDTITVNHDGISTDVFYSYDTQATALDVGYTGTGQGNGTIMPLIEIKSEFMQEAFIVNDSSYGARPQSGQSGEDFVRVNSQFIALRDVDNCNFEFKIAGGIYNQAPGGGVDISLRVNIWIFRNGDLINIFNSDTVVYVSPPATPGNSVTFNDTVQYPYDIKQGDYILIFVDRTGTTFTEFDFFLYSGSQLNITGSIRSAPIDIRQFTYAKFLDKFFEQAFGAGLVSDFFTATPNRPQLYGNDPRYVCITSAKEVKGFVKTDITVSFDDIKTDLLKWGLGWGVEDNKIRVEPAEYFYKDTVIADIRDFESIDVAVDTDVLGNIIRIGYDNQDTEIPGGIYDYNGTIEYSLPVSAISKNVELVSEFIASPYVIQRAIYYRFDNKDTQDTQQDDNIFLMSVNPTPADGKYNLYRPTGTFSGVNYPATLYNYDITPARNLYFNAPLILTMLAGKDFLNDYIKFTKSDKQTQLSSQFESPRTIVENGVYQLDTFRRKGDEVTANRMLYYPAIIKLRAEVPDNLLQLMEGNKKYGVIRFLKDGTWFGIHVDDIALKKGKKEVYEITGKCHRNNDIYKLLA